MAEMSEETALAILGLEQGASTVEIDERFHRVASETHPDHGGTVDAFKQAVAARDRLKQEAPGGNLVRVQETGSALASTHGAELVQIERERDADRKLQQHSERVTKGLVRAEVSRLSRSKRRASFLTWLSGGAAALTITLRATGSTAEGYIGFPWVAWVIVLSVIVAAVCSVANFAIADQISRIEQAIEDAAETMSRRSTYLDLLYEITEAVDLNEQNGWTTGQLAKAVSVWSRENSTGTEWDRDAKSVPGFVRLAGFPFFALRRIARWSVTGRYDPTPSLADLAKVIGAQGFVRLLLAKGEETRLLLDQEEVADGRLFVRHQLSLADAGLVNGGAPGT
jgi:hypothetical protein